MTKSVGIHGMTTEYKVLDHGYVKYIGHYGSDEGIIEAARMSTDKGFQGWDSDASLLEYLFSHFHSTPFEMPDLTIEVQAPIMVFREWVRHRTQSFNELSARYTALPNLYYLPSLDRIQKQSSANKQGSGESFSEEEAVQIQNEIRIEQETIRHNYESFLERGVAREVARINCAVSQYSRMRAKANLLNWLRFMTLRCAPAAQWEIRQFANAVANIVKDLYPRTYSLFEEYSLGGVHFGKSEIELIRGVMDSYGPAFIRTIAYTAFGKNRKAKEFLEKIGLESD